jgi:hypothetical protein
MKNIKDYLFKTEHLRKIIKVTKSKDKKSKK